MFLYLALLGAVLVLSTIFILRKTPPPYSSTTTTTEDGAVVPPEPPRVPFWVPFVGNALAFGRDSQGYLQRCQKTYGDAFRLKMMGQDYVFVLDPFSFPNVFREEKKNLSFIAIVREFACKCFGASWDEFEKQNHETVHKQFITYLQGVELPALTARMREHLERAVKEKTQPQLLRADTSTEWQDGHMWRFVMEVLYVAGTRAFFGDTFDVEQSFKDFFAFDDNFPAFTIGVPDILLRKSVKARQRMNDLLVHLTDPTASKLMVERERYLAEETSIPPNQISRLQFATFWAAHGNTLPSAFWSLAYILSDKRAKQEITEEVFAHFNKKDTGRETFAKLKDMVKLESAINEALRLSSASIIVREVMNDFTLKMQNGDQFHVKHGQKVAMYPYIIHNNPEVYDKPHVYQFDRFLADECQDDDDYAHLKFIPSTKVPGNIERVESADVLHLKQRELRQLRESRRRERDLRESRTIHTSAATTAASAAAPAADADLNVDDTIDDPQDLRESREQTMRDLRASGRLFSLILRESGVSSIPTAGEGETEVVGAPGKEESSSPPKKPQFTLGEKLRQSEKEEEGNGNNCEHEQEERLATPTSKRSLRFPGAPTLQEQLSSSGEVDLASPLFLRRAQRMRRYDAEADAENEGNDSDSGSSPMTSPKRAKHAATTAKTTSPSMPLIQVDNVDISSDPASLSSAGEQAKSEEEKSEAEETKPATPFFKAGSGLRRSKQLLQIAANNRRDRSVSLGVVPQLSVDVAPTTAGSDQSGQPEVNNESNTTGVDLPSVSIAEALAFQPVATSASTSTAGLASPRISREQHLMFKKRERTGSFNIPGDPRLQQRAKEKKFYYKGRELRYHLMPFGGGAGMCPGRFFARNELKLFVAVMIYYFDLELVPNEQGEIKLPPLDETRLGIGILPPAKDLPFRFRLREEHLADFAAPQEKQQA